MIIDNACLVHVGDVELDVCLLVESGLTPAVNRVPHRGKETMGQPPPTQIAPPYPTMGGSSHSGWKLTRARELRPSVTSVFSTMLSSFSTCWERGESLEPGCRAKHTFCLPR